MSHRVNTRGYYLAGVIFAAIVAFCVIKSDMLINSFLSNSKVLPVRAVQIDGVFKYLTKKHIADITGKVCAGQNIAKLDLTILQNTLMEEPWVAQVAIRKKMPDTIMLSVVEHVPAAYWNDNGLYDARTRSIFYPDLENFSQPLVKLGAFRDNLCSDVYETAVLFTKAMNRSHYQMVELYLDNVRCYNMTLENGTRLILGRGQKDALVRLERFLKAFPQSGLNIDDVDYVDLRYDVGFAIGKKGSAK